MVDVGREHEIIFASNNFQEFSVSRIRRQVVAIIKNVAAPISPKLFGRLVGIEAAAVHVVEVVSRLKVREIFSEAFAVIGVARRRR